MEKATRRSSFAASMVVAAVVLLCPLAGTSAAAAGDTTRVSVASDGTEANQPSYGPTSFSADGRYVAFSSRASNLVPGDTNHESTGGPALDIFVRDRDADNDGVMDEPEATKTERVSVDSSGSEANGSSFFGSISADGRFVVFSSDANNLVPGDTNVDPLGNPASDIFVRDRDADNDGVMDEPEATKTERVSVSSSETEANSYSNHSSISADGRFVAFSSDANNLAADDTLLDEDIFVRDRQARTTELVSVGAGNWNTYGPSISADGRYVAFFSSSPTLVSGDTNGRPDVFVRDLVNKTTERIRAECATFSCSFQSTPSISANGRYVAFESDASDLVVGDTDTNGRPDVFVRDRQAGTTQRVSVAGCATEANGDSLSPSISSDGRYIAFPSSATNLVSGDTNGFGDVFVRDLVNKTTQRVSVGGSGTQGNGGSGSTSPISISASGVYVAFGSSATNLVEGDTKGFDDIFVHERRNVTQPQGDCVAPTTTASATTSEGAYTSGTWTNENIILTLSSQDDEGGSGVKEIRYSATGAQSIPETVYDPQNLPIITAEGTTTVSYFATDNAGNQESPAETFTVKLDKTGPTIDSVSPTHTATEVSPSANVEATFSEAMDQTTLTTGTFTLTKQGSTSPLADTKVRYDGAYKKATLDPDSSLEGNTTYTARVMGGANGAQDLAGNALEQDYSWSFTTAAPPAPNCTKTGTANAETISGTYGADVICAGGGNDTIKGLGGNDVLKGQGGNDTLLGGVGSDTLDGGTGTDTASYSASLTPVTASLATNSSTGEGSDTFLGVENLLGSSNADTLTGSTTNNVLTGGGGIDTEYGGSGNDTVIGSSGADTLRGEDGDDTVNSKDGVSGNDSLYGGTGTDTKVTDATEKSIMGFP